MPGVEGVLRDFASSDAVDGIVLDSAVLRVACRGQGTELTVLRLPDHSVAKVIKVEGRPMGVTAAPDGKLVFVTTGRGGKVLLIDPAKDEVTGSVAVGDRPWGIAVTPDGKTLFVANGPSDDVSIVDVASRKETSRTKLPTGSRPWGVVVVPGPS